MNDAGAAWSLPWHALQNRLASGLGACGPLWRLLPRDEIGATPEALSWLRRGRHGDRHLGAEVRAPK